MLWAQAYLRVLCVSVPIFLWKTATCFLLKSGKKEAQSQKSILYGMCWSIKYQYQKKMEWNRKSTLNENVFTSMDLCINNDTSTIMFLQSTTRFCYQCLVSCMYNLGEVTPRIFNSLSIKSNSPKEVFLPNFTILRDTTLQEFQFILLYDILITNYWLKRFELSETDACTFCVIESESLLHLFWSCRYAADFWSEVEKWWFTNPGKLWA